MLNYDNQISNEQIRLNIKVKKIEQPKNNANKVVTSADSKINHKIIKSLKRQKLKPDEIHFGKLPIQKLVPIPFRNCVSYFSSIERGEYSIFIHFEMHREWIDYIIRLIRNKQENIADLTSNAEFNCDSLDIEVIEMDGQVMYSIGTRLSSFYMTFSERYPYVFVVCGTEYLVENKVCTKKQIPQKELKKGLLHYIFSKWSN